MKNIIKGNFIKYFPLMLILIFFNAGLEFIELDDIIVDHLNRIYITYGNPNHKSYRWEAASIIKNDFSSIKFNDVLKANGHACKIKEENNFFKVQKTIGKGYLVIKDHFTNHSYQFKPGVNISKTAFFNLLSLWHFNQDMKIINKDWLSFAYNSQNDYYLITFIPNLKFETIDFKYRQTYYKENITYILLLFFVILLQFLPIIVIYIYYLNTKSQKSISKMSHIISKITQNNYNLQIKEVPVHEFMPLINNLNILINKIQHITKRTVFENKLRDFLILTTYNELRAPLQNITGICSRMNTLNTLDSDYSNQAAMLHELNINSIQINNSIKNLFDLSYYKNDSLSLNLEKHNLTELIIELIAQFIPEFEKQNLNFQYDIVRSSIFVKINKASFVQALSTIFLLILECAKDNSLVIFDYRIFPQQKITAAKNILLEFNFDITTNHLFNINNNLKLNLAKTIFEKHNLTLQIDSYLSSFKIYLPAARINVAEYIRKVLNYVKYKHFIFKKGN